MATIHFSWTISPNTTMTRQSLVAIAAARELGPCTIWVHAPDIEKVDPQLTRLAEVLPYESDPEIILPWASTPKWRVTPRADVVMGTNADVFAWSPQKVRRMAAQCLSEQSLFGVIAYWEPFDTPEWASLFHEYGLPADFSYRYQNLDKPSPFYINNGAVMMPSAMLPAFRESFYHHLPLINRKYRENYFMVQVATTIAIYKAGLRRHGVHKLFNYMVDECFNQSLLDEVAFLHLKEYDKATRNRRLAPIVARCDNLLRSL